MAGEALGIVGYCYLNPTSVTSAPDDEVLIPLLEGSRFDEPEALMPDLVAMGLNSAATWLQGVKTPVMMINTRLYGGTGKWFTVLRLKRMLYWDGSSGTNAVTGAGVIQSSLGEVVWRHNNETARQWEACKVGSLTLSGGEGGAAVGCTMLLLPYGAEQETPDAPTNLASPPAGRLAYLTQGVSYSGTAADVMGWSINFNLNMAPDNTTPMTVGTNGVTYPNNYFNEGPILPTVRLITKKVTSPTVPDAANPTAVGNLIVKLQDPTATAGNDVFIRIWSLMPDKSRPVVVRKSFTERNYQAIMKDENEPAYTIAAT